MDEETLKSGIEEALEDDGITLVKTSSSRYQSTNLTIMEALVNDHGLPGVYVTVNKPYTTITRLLDDNDIDPTRLFFIDAISKDMNAKRKDEDNVIFVESPQRLTDTSIVMTEAVQGMTDKEKFVFFDSMSVLTIYNESKRSPSSHTTSQARCAHGTSQASSSQSKTR